MHVVEDSGRHTFYIHDIVSIVFGMDFIAIFTAENLLCSKCIYLIVKVQDFEGQFIFI
jgi:hypothetical protein